MVSAEKAASRNAITVEVTKTSPAHLGTEDSAVENVLQKMYESSKPLILVDGLTYRYDILEEVNELVRITGFPTLTLSFGDGAVDHRLESY